MEEKVPLKVTSFSVYHNRRGLLVVSTGIIIEELFLICCEIFRKRNILREKTLT